MKRLIFMLVVALVIPAPAQIITTLKTYRSGFDDWVGPPSQLVQGGDGSLYGMDEVKLCKMQPDGSGYVVLKRMPLNSDYFVGHPAVSGGTLYGATYSGTVFKINTDGTGYTVLKTNVVAAPDAVVTPGIVLSDNTLYGWGYKINTDGTGYTELAGFPAWDGLQNWHLDILVSGDKIFGTTARDGKYGAGTVFRLNTDGTGYTVLLDFPAADFSNVEAYLTLADGTLYVASYPGFGHGKVFKMRTDGNGYSVLKEFGEADGALSGGPLVHYGGKLYGSTGFTDNFLGFPTNWNVFSIETNGSGYTPLRPFKASTQPLNGPGSVQVLTMGDGMLYGLAQSAGGFDGDPDGLDGRGGALFRMNTNGSSFQVLKEFEVYRSVDGLRPDPLALSEGILYGFVEARLFKMGTDGTGYTTLKQYYSPYPSGRPMVSGDTIYGKGGGGVVAMNTDGTNLRLVKDAIYAEGELSLSGDTIYGSVPGDGFTTEGQLFKLNTDGTSYEVLHSFGLFAFDPSLGRYTNSAGTHLTGDLTVSGNAIYGTAKEGGEFGAGTVFKLNTDGTGFTVLKHFRYPEWDTNSMSYIYTDGAAPLPGLLLVSNTIYGVTSDGGEFWTGTLFKMNTDGTGFMVVKQFEGIDYYNHDPYSPVYTNNEGAFPRPGLAHWGNTLYGTTSVGGQFGSGTVYKVNTDGTGFTVLTHNGNTNGPWIGTHSMERFVSSGSTLFAAAQYGGDEGRGGIYRIDLEPTLSISRAVDTLAVSWPSVWTDYVLQQNANGLSSLTWSNVTDTIQDDGTNKSLIVSPTNGTRFYRLVKP